jgi:hypothetical protein
LKFAYVGSDGETELNEPSESEESHCRQPTGDDVHKLIRINLGWKRGDNTKQPKYLQMPEYRMEI